MSAFLPHLLPRLASLSCVVLAAIVASCARGKHSSDGAAAAATIGPEGGTVAVDSGLLAGTLLTVPAGAVSDLVTFRIFAEELPQTVGPGATALAPVPGVALRVEPRNLVLNEQCRLRLPYRPSAVLGTGPGNVRARQDSPWATTEWPPLTVDIADGLVEIETRTLGRFEVVRGPTVGSLSAYVPVTATAVQLESGYSFAVEEVPAESPFAAQEAVQWRITGPGFEERLILVGSELVARESNMPSWRERWDRPLDVLVPLPDGFYSRDSDLSLETPIGGAAGTGYMVAVAYRQFADPRMVLGELALDVMRVSLDLAWDRSDIGTGQRAMTFWFSPPLGLAALMLDGQLLERVQ